MKSIFSIISIIVLLLAVIFGMSYFNLSMSRFFAPKQEALRNQVFHESQAYTDGMVRDLEEAQQQYIDATPDGKRALRAIVLHRFSVYPIDRMTPDEQQFYLTLKQQ